jgi:MerR family copper efflux transcriptional regulator
MANKLTFGQVAKQTGISREALRFYEGEGLIPPPVRTEAGYRLYGPTDVRRLHLVRQARLLGLTLPEVKTLVDRAFTSECGEFADQLLEMVAKQRDEISRRIAELEALRDDLDELERHVRHEKGCAQPGQLVAECGYCFLIDEEGGAC